MPTGLAVPTLAGRLLATQCSSEITWCLGPPSISIRSPSPVPRPNIELWLMVLLKLLGSANCSMSFATRLVVPPWSTVTISVLCISPATRCNISGRSMYLHFVRERVALGHVRVLHVPTTFQYTDVFTKGLPTSLFQEFRSTLNVRCAPGQTVGEC
jgi:hypothetical protein